MSRALRLMVYDRTCRGPSWRPGLSHIWASGARLYSGLGRFDATLGADSWAQALSWLASVSSTQRIAQIQYWGHGKWGAAKLGDESLDVDCLDAAHEHHAALRSIRERLTPDGRAEFWFRTCELFGGEPGQSFARAWTRFFDCRAAGHTFIIGEWQSGLHSLTPDSDPDWSPREGIKRGTASAPELAYGSGPLRPNTVSFLRGTIPPGY